MAIELADDGLSDEVEDNNVFVRIGGKAHRCECGANVFSKLSERFVDEGIEWIVYRCNGCQTEIGAR